MKDMKRASLAHDRLFTNRVVEGWTSVVVTVLFLGGIQLIALGIQGAYLGRIYNEVKRRPRYLVRRAYGFEE
jgi:dolichol-phosphate mannosyltransferase